MNLTEKHRMLSHALQPLGIDVGNDVLNLWTDRAIHGRNPLPTSALEELAQAVNTLLTQPPP